MARSRGARKRNNGGGCLGCFTVILFVLLLFVGLVVLLVEKQAVIDFCETHFAVFGRDDLVEKEDGQASFLWAEETAASVLTPEELLAQLETSTDVFAEDIDRYGYQTLSTAERISYILTAQCVLEMAQEVEIPAQGSVDLEKVWPIVRADFPEVFWVASSVTRTITTGDVEEVWFIPTYDITAQERAEREALIAQTANLYFASLAADATDYQKVVAAYEFVICNTSYLETAYDQTIYGSLGQGQAVCASYARAIQYLLGRVGVACIYVSGEAVGDDSGIMTTHAWNIVQIAGEYYYLDATWGEDNWDTGVDYSYLCVNDADLGTTHFANDRYALPAVDGVTYNYYRMQSTYLETYSAAAVQSAIATQLDMGYYTMRFASSDALDAALRALMDKGELYDIFRNLGVDSREISYTIKENVNVLTIYPE